MEQNYPLANICVCSQRYNLTFAKKDFATEEVSSKETVIVHSEYNRYDIQQERVREIWDETCEILQKDVKDGDLGIKCVICAYSRPINLKDLLQRAKLHENADHRASSFLRGQ